MANTKERSSKTVERKKGKLRPGAIQELWWRIPVKEWYNLLQQAKFKGRWELKGNTVKGCCPYHDDSTPSFVIDFAHGRAKCFGSCGKYVKDPISLYAKVNECSYLAAVSDLSSRFDLHAIFGDGLNDLAQFNNQQEMKKYAAMAMRKVIDEYVRDRPKHLEYLLPAIQYLQQGRHIPLNAIGSLPVGIFAKPEHLKKYIPEDFHDLFDVYFKKVNEAFIGTKEIPSKFGSVCFHYNDLPGSISRFKMRQLSRDAQERCAAYPIGTQMSQEDAKSLVTKDFYVVDDPYIEDMGVFGLHFYNRLLGNTSGSLGSDAYVTEGEFDALSVMVSQIEDSRNDFMIFAVGGNGNNGISFLRDFGLRTIWVVQDHPNKSGDGVVERLLSNVRNFEGDSNNWPLKYRIYIWPKNIRGGDLDEAVEKNGYSAIVESLVTQRTSTFYTSYNWVFNKCTAAIKQRKDEIQERLRGLDREQDAVAFDNMEDDIKDAVVRTVQHWLPLIHEEREQRQFIEAFSESEHVSMNDLSAMNAIIYNLNTFDGAANRISEGLKKYFNVTYSSESGAKKSIQFHVWSIVRREIAIWDINDRNFQGWFMYYVGKDPTDWVLQLLKGGKAIELPPCKTAVARRKAEKQLASEYLESGFNNLVVGVKKITDFIDVGQGIHYRDLPNNYSHIYFVNGMSVFRGTVTNDSDVPVEWEYINNTVDKTYNFLLDTQRKWSNISDVTDLYSSTKVDLHKLYDDIRTILDGWRFEDHELTRDYLAAWIMSLPVHKAIGQVNITFVTGESASGKTSLLRGLLGGNLNKVSFDVPSILEGSWYSSDASLAGIYQELDQSAITLCLDESESRQGTDHSNRVKAITEMAYSVPFGGATITRGGATKDHRTVYTLQLPIIMAGINMASNPTFLSRVIPIYTEKDLERQNIGVYIDQHFSVDQIKEIRRNVTIALLDKIPILASMLPKLREKLYRLTTETQVNDRFITVLLPVLAVYEYLGYDVTEMYQRMVTKNQNLLENINSQDFHSDLLNAVLYTPGIRVSYDGDNSVANMVSAQELLRQKDFDTLNNSSVGVKYLPEKNWIIVIWNNAKYSLLRFSEYRYYDVPTMKESVSKNKYVIHKLTKDDHQYVRDSLNRTDIKNTSQYTVVNATYVFDNTVVVAAEADKNRWKAAGKALSDSAAVNGPNSVPPPIEAYEDDPSAYGADFSL